MAKKKADGVIYVDDKVVGVIELKDKTQNLDKMRLKHLTITLRTQTQNI